MLLDTWNVFTSDFGTMPKPYTAFATLLDIVLYTIVTANVGRARGEYKIKAPATDGPEAFQRIFRVQANTVEQLIMHLPLLWIAAFAMADSFAASLGLIWFVSRILYARGYYQKAKRRTKGFLIGMIVNAILLIGAVTGTIASF